MKTYTKKSVLKKQFEVPAFDFSIHLPASYKLYLKKAFKHYLISNWFVNALLVGALLVGFGFYLYGEDAMKYIVTSGLTLIYEWAKAIYNYYKLYKSHNSVIFYRIDKYGISMMQDLTKKCRYDSVDWSYVKKIYEYDDLAVISLKDNDSIPTQIFIFDEEKKNLDNLLCYWQSNLNGIDPDSMPDFYSPSEMEQVEDFIEETFGEIDLIGHETISTDLHTDLIFIKPTKDRPYYTVCTCGIGAYRMTLDQEDRVENEIPEYNEYLIHLPANWNVSDEGFENEENWWPIRLLKTVAREPKSSKDIFRVNEIVSYNDINTYTKATSAFLDYPLPDPQVETYFSTNTGRTINFLQIVPITSEEAYHFDNQESTDYYEKSTYYYGFDTSKTSSMYPHERIALYTEHIIKHFESIVNR